MARRGRPPGSRNRANAIPDPDVDENSPGIDATGNPVDSDTGVAVDPAAAFGADIRGSDDSGTARTDDGTAPKRRGRRPGSSNKKASLDLSGLEAILLSVHTMGAVALKSPELAIGKDEAEKLASAINQVQQYYPMTVDPKTMAWLNLAGIAGMIYVPRLILMAKRQKVEKPKNEVKTPVTPTSTATNGLIGLGATNGMAPQEDGTFTVTH